MKTVTVISGKGGTGKTSLLASFASLLDNKPVLVDGDVDAANLALITGADILETHYFSASKVAVADPAKCNNCGLCLELCRFGAVAGDYSMDPVACEGCSFCAYACPEGAIEMRDKVSGQWFVSRTAYGSLVHARLGIAEENSGKLVTIVRNKGRELAEGEKKEYLLIDGPPGIGCPVIAALSGVDAALVIAEPTVSGLHDLERVLSVCRHFGVKASVCINRYDLGIEQSKQIEEYCLKQGLVMVGKIPYDRAFVEAMVQGVPVTEYTNGALKDEIVAAWKNFINHPAIF